MSYSFGMFFKEINEVEEVLALFDKTCEIMIDNSTKVLENQKCYIPSIKSNKMNEYVDEYWLDTIFSLNFVYWKEKKILGLSGYNYPQELIDLFDCHVCFQNSCDQDYEYNTWSDKISFFKQYKKKCINITVEEILKQYNEKGVDWYTKEDIQKNLDYHKKSVLYNMIFNELALNEWLYGVNSNCFKRYTINAIDCIERKLEIHRKLKELVATINFIDTHKIGDKVKIKGTLIGTKFPRYLEGGYLTIVGFTKKGNVKCRWDEGTIFNISPVYLKDLE